MPEISPDKATVVTYPPQSLYEDWREHADSLDMSVSRYIIRMVEGGRKNIAFNDLSNHSLRNLMQEKSDLQKEVQRQRDRIHELERQLRRTSQSDIVAFVDENPGASTPEIMQLVADTVPGRVASHLDVLEGELVQERDGRYYPIESEE